MFLYESTSKLHAVNGISLYFFRHAVATLFKDAKYFENFLHAAVWSAIVHDDDFYAFLYIWLNTELIQRSKYFSTLYTGIMTLI